MPTCRERSRRQNAWRIESLEDRNLLSVMVPVAHVHTLTQHPNPAPRPVTIATSFNGTFQNPGNQTQFSSITGSAKASAIGRFTATVTPSLQDFRQGTFTIQIASGGSIKGLYSGSVTPTKKSSVDLVKLSGSIIDGTTPFTSANGTFSTTANANLSTSQISGTIRLSFRHK
jgi:hypothetical protein